jgi:predicted nucleic acid-binding Zn ribbon protein
MKYRKCLWCWDFFWAYHTEKTCSEECAKLRRNEKQAKASRRRYAREKAIRADATEKARRLYA